MSVIINDFELVADQEEAPAATTNGETARPSQPPPPITPMDVVEIMKRRERRRARLRAH